MFCQHVLVGLIELLSLEIPFNYHHSGTWTDNKKKIVSTALPQRKAIATAILNA